MGILGNGKMSLLGAGDEGVAGGVGHAAYIGRPQGSPLRGKDDGVGGGRMREDNGRITPILTFPPAGGKGFWGSERDGLREITWRVVREARLRGVGHAAYNGRPQGSPLRGKVAGGWAWGTIDSSLRCAAFRMTCGWRGKGFWGAERSF